MARLDFSRFVRPETLKRVDVDRLQAFLTTCGGAFVVDAVDVGQRPMPYEAVAQLLASPDQNYPSSLIEALSLATDFAKQPAAAGELREAAAGAGFPTTVDAGGRQMTVEDIVVALWLDDRGRSLARQIHAEHCSANPREFISYYPDDDSPDLAGDFGDEARRAMENDLNDFYGQVTGARGVRITRSAKGKALWLIVRLPAPWEARVYVDNKGDDDLRHGNPEAYDVVIYSPEHRELSIHTETKRQRDRYREIIGLRAFGDADRFAAEGSVTLEPLRSQRRGALGVADIDGIHEITLVEIAFVWRNQLRDRMTRRSKDIFETYRDRPFPRATIHHAVFDVTFRAGSRPVAVRVYAGAKASYARDTGHECVRAWLAARGFHPRRGASTDVESFWRKVVGFDGVVMTRAEWISVFGDLVDTGAQLFAVTDGPAPTLPCPNGGSNACRRVLLATSDDGSVYRCGDEPTRCPAVAIPKRDAVGLRLNLQWLAHILAHAIPTEPGSDVAADDYACGVWRLGVRSVGSTRVEFAFSWGSEPDSFWRDVDALSRAIEPAWAVVLVPTTSHFSARDITTAAEARVRVVGLDHVGHFRSGEVAIDLWPIVEPCLHHWSDAYPPDFFGDRYDVMADVSGDRYWFFGAKVSFGAREVIPKTLFRLLAERPGRRVTYADLMVALPDKVPYKANRNAFASYKFDMLQAISKGRGKQAPTFDPEIIESISGGGADSAYILRVATGRVLYRS